MARRGYPVTIYEKRTLPGGLLRHAIPDFRLPREIVEAETRRILALPVELVCGVDVGHGIGLQELQTRHRMLFVGIGAPSPRKLGVPGEEGPGVMSGIEYLTRRKLGHKTDLGRHVVVIGAGDTAIDTARSARRDGAEVTLLYRRSPAEMPAQPSEVRDARTERVRFEYLTDARRIQRSGQRIHGVEVQRMRLGDAAEDGRRQPIPIPHAALSLAADTIMPAVSQEPDWRDIAVPGHEHDWRHVGTDGRLADGLWAGGDDCGAGIAIRAIAQGRAAAEAAHATLRNRVRSRPPQSPPLLEPARLKTDCYEHAARARTIRRPATQWLGEPEIEIDRTLTGEQALREAGRCFSCGLCFGCEQCFMYCNSGGFTRIPSTAPGRYFNFLPECCEGCGRCIELCPCAYLQPREGSRES
jgi:NADPH-dependent glutamate synthase beta subunit-like oxidoreductase/NAD-dependent dihydropyrimidine dehydrogenase PreA subunit